MATAAGKGSIWNPNSWHWENLNFNKFAVEQLTELLQGVEVSNDKAEARIYEVRYVRGECDVHIRKGRRIPIFDLEIKCRWRGSPLAPQAQQQQGKGSKKGQKGRKSVRGFVEIPALVNEDVEDDEYEVRPPTDRPTDRPTD